MSAAFSELRQQRRAWKRKIVQRQKASTDYTVARQRRLPGCLEHEGYRKSKILPLRLAGAARVTYSLEENVKA